MPELPEVETIRRDLEQTILHKTICAVKVVDPFVLRTPEKNFIKSIKGQSIAVISRRGKALIIELSNGSYLVIQLMMTGQLIVGKKADKHSRVIFKLTDGSELLYNDQRRFGQLRTVKSLKEVKHLEILGPEPFDPAFHGDFIFEYTRQSKRPIKTLLLDHTFVAGIGNIYACEILFRAKISPKTLSCHLTAAQTKILHKEIVAVLKLAIKHRGSSMRNYRDAKGEEGSFKKLILVYAREGKNCLICKSLIQRFVQAGRSTFFCPQCQK